VKENNCVNYGYWGDAKRITKEGKVYRFDGIRTRVVNRCVLDRKRCHKTKCDEYEEV
jgi:hypothetical protein